jgi:hypothetical protein
MDEAACRYHPLSRPAVMTLCLPGSSGFNWPGRRHRFNHKNVMMQNNRYAVALMDANPYASATYEVNRSLARLFVGLNP